MQWLLSLVLTQVGVAGRSVSLLQHTSDDQKIEPPNLFCIKRKSQSLPGWSSSAEPITSRNRTSLFLLQWSVEVGLEVVVQGDLRHYMARSWHATPMHSLAERMASIALALLCKLGKNNDPLEYDALTFPPISLYSLYPLLVWYQAHRAPR